MTDTGPHDRPPFAPRDLLAAATAYRCPDCWDAWSEHGPNGCDAGEWCECTLTGSDDRSLQRGDGF